jgi:hypothetical protein
VLKSKLGFNNPSVLIDGSTIYEEGDDADESLAENLPKLLKNCPAGGVTDGTILMIEDYTQDLETNIIVKHVEDSSFDDDSNKEETVEHFRILGEAQQLERENRTSVSNSNDDSELISDPTNSLHQNKRASSDVTDGVEDEIPAAKRSKVEVALQDDTNSNVIFLD